MLEDILLGLLPAKLYPFATIGDLPGTQKDEICLMLYDGMSNAEYFGGRKGSTIYQPIVKVVVRNNSYEVAKQWVEDVKDAFHRYTDENRGEVLSILMVGSPMYLGRSPQKLNEFQVTFNIQTKE